MVTLGADASCADISWDGVRFLPSFSSSPNSIFKVYGSFSFAKAMRNDLKGEIRFLSSTQNNSIRSSGNHFNSSIRFEGEGYWILEDDLSLDGDACIYLEKGKLNTNSKEVSCSSFYASGKENRGLIPGNTRFLIGKYWDLSDNSNLYFSEDGNYSIEFKEKLAKQFKGGNFHYNKIVQPQATCAGSPTNIVITVSSTPDSCNAPPCNGTATAVVSGGTPPYSFNWTPGGQSTATATGLCAGGYIVDVTDANGDICSEVVSVVQSPPILINITFVRPLCNGDCNGSITANPTGGTGTFVSYSWSTIPSQSTPTATGLCAGTYTIFVKDSYGCTAQRTVVLTQPPVLVPNGSFVDVLCFGQCTGSITVNPSGGTPPYSYLWNPGNATTASITGLCAPTCYTVTIRDANNCPATFSHCVSQPTQLTATTSQTNLLCNNVCIGTATVNVSGGVPNYSYSWNTIPVQTNATATGLCAGNYTCTITDANGCTLQKTFTITQPSALTITPTQVNLLCNSVCNGTATATASGGTPVYSYSWNTVPTQTTATATGLCAGSYTCTVTDNNGCTATATFTITQPPQLTATSSQQNILCFNQCNGTATVTPSGGTPNYTYSWNTVPSQTTSTATGLCAGNYTCTVKDANNCSITVTFTITQPPQLIASVSQTNTPCNSTCQGTATVNPSGGTPNYSYSWNTVPTQTTQTATGLCAGNYTCTITDANGCTITRTFTITQPTLLTVSLNPTTIPCNGQCNASIGSSVSGGTAPYQYSWSPGNQTTNSITGLCAGSYTLTVTDNQGCTATANVTINQPTALTLVTASNPVICFGQCNGSASAIAGGGTPPYQYNWAPGGQTTATITGQCAGSYTVTATDANGCTIQQTVVIIQPTQLTLNFSSTNVTCFGSCDGTASTSVSGGTPPYQYSWAPGGQTTSSISNLCPGNYNVTVTDANGCTAQQFFQITQPQPLSAVISATTTACNICNGTATVTVSGGTAPLVFSWNTIPSQSTQTATGLCPGNYTVYVTDANGCTTSAVATVTLTVVIQITTSGNTLTCNAVCSGIACATPSGGQAPYSYLWTPGPFQTTQCATGLCAGTYTVNVTDANGCTGIDSVTFVNPPQLISSASTTNTSCNNACDGTATGSGVGGTGSYTYSWTPGGQTTQTATGLCAGSYILTVTDANGCTDTTAVTITQATAIAANQVINDANCTLCDGSITVAPTGGIPPYTYLWSTGGTTPTINNLCPGAYTVTITDAAGCTSQFTFAVGNIQGPTVTLTVTNASCNAVCDGLITSTVSGGTSPYTYSWNPANQTTTGISNLCAGTYTLWVTDTPGCIGLAIATVSQPLPVTATAVVVNSTCANNCNGSITLTPSGGTGPYTFAWTGPNAFSSTNQNINGLCAGNYVVTITDANGCTGTANFNITQPPTLTNSMTFTNVNCFNACDGTATANPSGGTGPYSYIWSNGPITQTVVGLCPGTYTVTITDANNCAIIDSVTITQPTQLTATAVQTNVTCFNACDGTSTVTPSGGTGPYSYSWFPGGMLTQTVNGLCAGTYNCQITDANGCTRLQVVVITQPTQVLPNTTVNNVTCNSLCNGTATANPSGGAGAPFTYVWNPGGQTTQTATGLCAGSYTVTVTDVNGCTGTQVVNITQPNPIFANPSVVNIPTCPNGCNGSLTCAPTGGTGPYTISWAPGGQTTTMATGLCSGNYTLTVTDVNGCTDQQQFTLPSLPPINVTWSVGQANCGVCNGTITATTSGGTGPYTYLWLPGGQTTVTATGVCAGIDTVIITDANNCQALFTVGVSNTSGGVITLNATSASCFGICDGSVSVSAVGNGPFSYSWAPGGNTTTSVSNLCANTYSVVVTDTNQCITVDSIPVTEPTQILDNAVVTNAQCNGICNGSVTINPSGGGGGPYTFAWTGPNAFTSTNQNVNGLCTGAYQVIITAANGCRDTFNYNILGTTVITITASSTNISCANTCSGTATVTNITGGAGPYTYLWSDPLGQFTATATGLCAGTYTVTVTDANGCMATSIVTISQTPAVTGTFSITQPSCGQCNGIVTVTPSGGQSPYTFSWSNNLTTSTINGVCAGLYSVQITDANGCTRTLNVPVSNSTNLTSSVTVTNASCFGTCDGTATSAPTGGTSPYAWNWLPNGQTTPSVNNLCAGTYFVQVIDAAGCIVTDSVVVASPTQIVTNQTVVNTMCGLCNGSISLNPSGGTGPYTYQWSNAAVTSSINNLCAGTYTVTITDANGCTQQYVIPITTINGPTVTVSASNINCNSSCNGTATPTVTGGVSPYNYSWSTGATSPTLNNLCPGTYWVQVTDATGCTATATFTITQPTAIFFSAPIVQNPKCNGDANGSISIVSAGGTLPYTYLWAPGGQTTSGINGLNASGGPYMVTVTDANGCTATLTVPLTDPPVLAATNGGVTASSCNTVADGAITLNVAGGTAPYTFLWSNGAITQNLSNVLSGNYTVTVTDANNCTDTVQFTVPSSVTVLANITGTDTICIGSCTTLSGTTSVNTLTYSWYDSPGNTLQGTNDSLSVCPSTLGTNFYLLIASNGLCSDTDTIAIVVNPLPPADAGPDASILVNQSVNIGGTPTGPNGSTYSWWPSNGLNNTTGANPTASPSVTTTYYVQVTSVDGCTSLDSVKVTVVPEIVFPNGISPNGDGANDYWIIDNITLFPDNVVEVYNRWGELLYQGVHYDNNNVKWDGTYKGKPLPVGTYYYIVNLHSPFYPDAFTGPITLMR
jgi:gliding motility-associated-like protein